MWDLIYTLLYVLLFLYVIRFMSGKVKKSIKFGLKKGDEIETTEHFGDCTKKYNKNNKETLYYYYSGKISKITNYEFGSILYFIDKRTQTECKITEHLIVPLDAKISNKYRPDNEKSDVFVEDILKKGRI